MVDRDWQDSHHNTDSRAPSGRGSLAKSNSKRGQQWHRVAPKHSPQGPKQNNTTGGARVNFKSNGPKKLKSRRGTK